MNGFFTYLKNVVSGGRQCLVVEDVDVFDESFFKNYFEFYPRFQKEQDVVFFPKSNSYGVFKYGLVKHVLQDKDNFTNSVFHEKDPILLGADGVKHTNAKKVLFKNLDYLKADFDHSNLAQNLIEKLVGEIHAGESKTVNAIDHIINPYVAYVVLLRFGLLERYPQVDMFSDVNQVEEKVELIRTLFSGTLVDDISEEAVRERKLSPELQKVLATFEKDGGHSKSDLVKFMKLFTQAEVLTTASMLASCLFFMFRLDENRLNDDGYLDGFVDEVLRVHSPSQFTQRMVERDTVLADVKLAKGSRICVFIGAANRDEKVFAKPEQFMFDRTERNIAFGAGKHKCIGERVALHTAKGFIRAFYPFYRMFEWDKHFVNANTTQIFKIGGLGMIKRN